MSALNIHRGPYGSAVQLPINPDLQGAETTLDWWLLTGPWHPLWSQFVLSVVRLRPVKGWPPAALHFEGATHELMVIALNPGEPPRVHSAEVLARGGCAAVGGYLQPVDVNHQFTATDSEMRDLADLSAKACVNGWLTPSTDDARSILRERWLASCVRTLAHMRGEAHAGGERP